MADQNRMKVALHGFGYAGRSFHGPLISACADLDLTSVISSQGEAVRAAYPNAAVVTDLDQVLADPAIDLVVLATPNAGHAAQAEQVLRAGKAVVVDKPFTLTLAEARALETLSRETGQLLSVFHNRRWDSDFLTLRHLVETEALGPVRRLESHFNRYRPQVRERWREGAGAGAGLWYDLGPHLIDQALCLFGRPLAVTCDLATLRPMGLAPDYAHAVLEYTHHRVILHADMVTPSADLRFALHGARASWFKSGLDVQEDQLKSGLAPDAADWGLDLRQGQIIDGETGAVITPDAPAGNYGAYYKAIAAALDGRGPNPVPPDQAVAVMEVLEAGLDSARLGQTIRLSST